MLVPLDGSVLSEKAIPSALELALGLDLGVTLVRVVSTVQLAMAGEWPAGYPDVLEEVEDDARVLPGDSRGAAPEPGCEPGGDTDGAG